MTSRTLAGNAAVVRPAPPRVVRSGGFTVVELLVVIGIILLLMGLLLPAASRAWHDSVRSRMFLDVQSLTTALEAYRQDHLDYPRVGVTDGGAKALFLGLVGPGPGFQVKAGGRTYGPYITLDRFKIDTAKQQILDRYGNPILYYSANVKADPTAANGFIAAVAYTGTGARPLYNANDNASLSIANLRVLLGDTNKNGKVDPGENPAYTGPYLLWSAGPDGVYGPATAAAITPKNPCDDVPNFPRSEY